MVLRTNKRFNFIYIFYAIAKQFKKCPPQFYVCVCMFFFMLQCKPFAVVSMGFHAFYIHHTLNKFM